MFRDRQIEVKYGTEVRCFNYDKCKTVIKAPKKKIIWASKRHNYEVEIEEGCCDKCKVEVEVGEIITCSKCGKIILNSITQIRVDPREKTKYRKGESQGICNDCDAKPVVWGKGVEGFTWKYRPFCRYCRHQVAIGATACANCTRTIKPIPGYCPECKQRGSWMCEQCNGTGTRRIQCQVCKGAGKHYDGFIKEWQRCRFCKGTGKEELSCNGSYRGHEFTIFCKNGRMVCGYCDGLGTIN